MKDKISVVINTYNAERHLEKVLNSVKDFDEIVVCDMESTDSTLAIAEKFGCKIVTFPKKDYVSAEPARNFAIQSASSYWVLVVDADEIITKELREYLYDRIKDENCPAGLYISRKNYIMNKFLKNSYPDPQLRFFKKEGSDWPPYVHTFPKVDGRTDKIPSQRMELAMIHISETVYEQLYKMNQYTENEVVKKQGEKITMFKIITKCTSRFIKNFFLKGGFRLGITGLVQAINSSNYKFYTMIKIWENQNKEQYEL
ncbi:MAG: glycosyltransferase family 2 protein [Salinivirgaceae bacterium]|nr:glycosyltransferase family 2 protein [Salinivirgaceae bacterium]